MIKYTLKCADGHAFESWFASASAFDSLLVAGHLACMHCGSGQVEKAIMTPRVSTATATGDGAMQAPSDTPVAARDDVAAALSRMRAEVEKNAAYVGGNFAREAREMYLGDAPDRPIWGEANAKEAKALIDDGVPVAPLPFFPTRKVN